MKQSGETTKRIARVALGSFLITAGIGHLSFARKAFRAQVPDFVPLKKDETVVYSGYVEIALGLAVLLARKRKRIVGKTLAAFFVAVFPGNVAQYAHKRSAFGLNSNRKRLGRLFLQPLLVYWAIKSAE